MAALFWICAYPPGSHYVVAVTDISGEVFGETFARASVFARYLLAPMAPHFRWFVIPAAEMPPRGAPPLFDGDRPMTSSECCEVTT